MVVVARRPERLPVGVRWREDLGRYEGRVRIVDPATGKAIRPSVYGATVKEVRDAMQEKVDRAESGRPLRDSSMRLADWMKTWRGSSLPARVPTGEIEQSTVDLYAGLSRTHIEVEEIGDVAIGKLTETDVSTWMVKLLDEDDLARSTVKTCWTVLAAGLDAAVKAKLIATNVVREETKRPKADSKEARHLTDAERERLAEELAEEPDQLDFTDLLLATGLRRGEALGLAWPYVDLERRSLRVAQALKRTSKGLVLSKPKTAKSVRTVPLNDDAVEILGALRKRQVEARLRAGAAWTPWKPKWGSGDLVFTTAIGGPIEPRNWLRRFQAAAKRAGLDGVSIHTLRHSTASAMLRANVNIRMVSELLGHASTSITWDVYQHVAPSDLRDAVSAISGRRRRPAEEPVADVRPIRREDRAV